MKPRRSFRKLVCPDPFLLTSLVEAQTGIPGLVLFATQQQSNGSEVVVYVSNHRDRMQLDDLFAINLEGKVVGGEMRLSDAELKRLRRLIAINAPAFTAYWDNSMSSAELVRCIFPL